MTVLRVTAAYGTTPEAHQYLVEHPMHPGRGSVTGRAALEGKAVHIADVLADPDYVMTGISEAVGLRTALAVPLLRDDAMIGAFSVSRTEVNPSTDKQIELVTTFAAQAVIAIGDTRLLDELRESLQEQTATSDVLKVVSCSPGDLRTVRYDTKECLQHLRRRIWQIFIGGMAGTAPRSGTQYAVSLRESARAHATTARSHRSTKSVVRVPILKRERSYLDRLPASVAAAVELGGVRSFSRSRCLKR